MMQPCLHKPSESEKSSVLIHPPPSGKIYLPLPAVFAQGPPAGFILAACLHFTLSVVCGQVDFQKLMAKDSMFGGDIPFNVMAGLTRKYVADIIIAKKWSLWASSVWPAVLPETAAWSINTPTFSSLVKELEGRTGSAKDEAIKTLAADFEEVIAGDWVYNMAHSVNETTSQLLAAVGHMVDFAHGTMLSGDACALDPLASIMLRVFAGIRGLLEPTPGAIAHHGPLDVSFLNPFSKSDECLGPTSFKSAAPLCRLFRTHDSWKEFRGTYQRFVGAEIARGKELGEFYGQLEVILHKVNTTIAEDDLEGETIQEEAMVDAFSILGKLVERRNVDTQAFRVGGLKRIDIICGLVLTQMWNLLKINIDEEALGKLAKMREFAKVLKLNDLFLAMNEVLMNRVEVRVWPHV